MPSKQLMIQGTASSAGKSLLVTALCRYFSRKGYSVAPFKAQNMSLNSFITPDGLEMGRAQVAQAEAAGVAPSAYMNPILLKPGSDRKSQVILHGKTHSVMDAKEYYQKRATFRPAVKEAFSILASSHDLIIIEGAGSPAEINLRDNDLANMGVAELVDAPVILIGDIDRGGVFASLYGTVKLLEPSEQARIQGIIINKFRGDPSILDPGLRQLEVLLGIPVLGVLPYMDVTLDEEDSLSEKLAKSPPKRTAFPQDSSTSKHSTASLSAELDIAVIKLPRITNFTDFAALELQPDVSIRYVSSPQELGEPDLILIPGSKSTLPDMQFLIESSLAGAICFLNATGTPVIGLGSGYPMLGRHIFDPERIESPLSEIAGLGLLHMETHIKKELSPSRLQLLIEQNHGLLSGTEGSMLEGYRTHMGEVISKESPLGKCWRNIHRTPDPHKTTGGQKLLQHNEEATRTLMEEAEVLEGSISQDGTIFGSSLHGIFDSDIFVRAVLNTIRNRKGLSPLICKEKTYTQYKEEEYERLADALEAHLDMARLEKIVQGWAEKEQ